MPFSKDPHKYPPEMLQLLEYLRTRPKDAIVIPCQMLPEANSRRVMIQSFFRSVERHADEQSRLLMSLRAKASTAAARKDGAAQDTAQDYSAMKSIVETWEDRAFVARQWMVKSEDYPPRVTIQKRRVEGAFGDNLRTMLAGTETAIPERPGPALHEGMAEPMTELDEQLALLRMGAAQLQETLSKTD